MRLSPQERTVIKEATQEVFGPESRVRLFGSRVNDDARGGDIDLLVELPQRQSDTRRKSLTLTAMLQMRLGDQPVDILVLDPDTPRQPIHKMAQATGVNL